MSVELDPLWPTDGDMAFALVVLTLEVAVFVASYRRSRVLSGYPVWRSVLTGLLSAWFWPIWVILSGINARQLMREWDEVRASRRRDQSPLTGPTPQ